jgi:probable phosphoglycerate mutase
MASDNVSETLLGTLTVREVCQVLREVVFGRLAMAKVGSQAWDEVYACHFVVDVEGWRITLYIDCDELDYCEQCISPDGRQWLFSIGDRLGTDPVALLSTWGHQTLERLLTAL